jgi:hypothetical protein
VLLPIGKGYVKMPPLYIFAYIMLDIMMMYLHNLDLQTLMCMADLGKILQVAAFRRMIIAW